MSKKINLIGLDVKNICITDLLEKNKGPLIKPFSMKRKIINLTLDIIAVVGIACATSLSFR